MLEFVAIIRKRTAPHSARLADFLTGEAVDLLKYKQAPAAKELLRECVAIRQQMAPDNWLLSEAQSLLGESLVNQQKYEEAESLLVAGYQGLQKQASSIPQDKAGVVADARRRLLEFYKAAGKVEQAKALESAGAEDAVVVPERP